MLSTLHVTDLCAQDSPTTMANTHSLPDLYMIDPLQEHTHTIIFVHGRGSIATEFASELFESQTSDGRALPEIFPTFKWVFPSLKMRMSARFGTELSQWFDIWSVEQPEERKELQVEGLRESIEYILDVVHNHAGVSPEKIFLAGISQGCATAIHALLHGSTRLGGFIGLCSWLPFQDELSTLTAALPVHQNISEAALATPIFLSHSLDDDVVPIKNGTMLFHGLRLLGMKDVTWKAYINGGHWVNEPQGVDDIVKFLNSQLRREQQSF